MANIMELDYTKARHSLPEITINKSKVYYLGIYYHKFWQLIKLNMLFFLFNLPSLIILPFIGLIALPNLNNILWLYYAVGSLLLCIPVITVGPSQAGFTYILRKFSRGESAYLWGDFQECARKTIKQSIIICSIDLVILLIFLIDLNFYFRQNSNSWYLSLINGFIIVLFMLFIMAHLYIYPMLVTFEFSIKQIYKNAFIFALIKFFPNLAIIALFFLLTVIPWLLFPIAGAILFLFITVSTTGLMINFYVYPVLEKYIINRGIKQ